MDKSSVSVLVAVAKVPLRDGLTALLDALPQLSVRTLPTCLPADLDEMLLPPPDFLLIDDVCGQSQMDQIANLIQEYNLQTRVLLFTDQPNRPDWCQQSAITAVLPIGMPANCLAAKLADLLASCAHLEVRLPTVHLKRENYHE